MDRIDKDEELVCPLCGGRLFWMPVSHIYACEHCKQSYSERNGVYMKKKRKSTAEKPSAVGDVAKLREALEYMFILIDGRHLVLECETTEEISGVQGKLAEARAALAAPPRNCDRPECATTKAAQDVWRKEDGGKTAYYEWLLATATERKEAKNDVA